MEIRQIVVKVVVVRHSPLISADLERVRTKKIIETKIGGCDSEVNSGSRLGSKDPLLKLPSANSQGEAQSNVPVSTSQVVSP